MHWNLILGATAGLGLLGASCWASFYMGARMAVNTFEIVLKAKLRPEEWKKVKNILVGASKG